MASIMTPNGPVDVSEYYGYDEAAPDYGPTWTGLTEHARPFTEDSRWKQLTASDRRHMKALLAAAHDPLTGHLEMRAVDLAEFLEVTEESLRQSRLRLIEAGLILSYQPGTGRAVSTYRIARSWDEAAESVS